MSIDNQTIVAQCTPQGSGALALIRFSGTQAVIVADQIGRLPGGQKLADQASHTIHLGQIVNQKEAVVDQVMFTVMRAPKTFTGEDVVEVTCHNNPFIVEQIIQLAIQNGARLALRGEFAQRAFLNQKIDLLQAEAINSLIGAHTEQALKKSLSQLKGSLSNWAIQIEKRLLHCIALAEASFEFIDEEIDFAPQITAELKTILQAIKEAQSSHSIANQIREGFRIALIGTVNAGKSALFNSLIKKERAIVTPIAGTTRDTIEAGIYTDQHYLTLIDTAGLRQTEDQIEQLGIEKSLTEAQSADLILLVFDASRPLTTPELKAYQELFETYHDKALTILNKCDLPAQINLPNSFENPIQISAKFNQNLSELESRILDHINQLLTKDTSPFLLNQRQLNLLNSVEHQCLKILKMLSQPEYELISLHLNETIQILAAITGKSVSEEALEAIFREFCVGK